MWFIAQTSDSLLGYEEAELNPAEVVQIVNLRDNFLLYFTLFGYCFFVVTCPLSHCKLLKVEIKSSW